MVPGQREGMARTIWEPGGAGISLVLPAIPRHPPVKPDDDVWELVLVRVCVDIAQLEFNKNAPRKHHKPHVK